MDNIETLQLVSDGESGLNFTSYEGIDMELPSLGEYLLEDYQEQPNKSYRYVTRYPMDYDILDEEDEGDEEGKEEPKVEQPAAPSSTIQSVVNTARKFVGGKYIWGGKSPKSGGFDCSGLLYYAYAQNGIKIPASTSGIFVTGKEVSLKNIQPGDIICTRGNGPTGRHVKMVSKVVNGVPYVVEAKGRKYGIVEHKLTNTKNIVTIRRVFGTTKAKLGSKLVRKGTTIIKRF